STIRVKDIQLTLTAPQRRQKAPAGTKVPAGAKSRSQNRTWTYTINAAGLRTRLRSSPSSSASPCGGRSPQQGRRPARQPTVPRHRHRDTRRPVGRRAPPRRAHTSEPVQAPCESCRSTRAHAQRIGSSDLSLPYLTANPRQVLVDLCQFLRAAIQLRLARIAQTRTDILQCLVERRRPPVLRLRLLRPPVQVTPHLRRHLRALAQLVLALERHQRRLRVLRVLRTKRCPLVSVHMEATTEHRYCRVLIADPEGAFRRHDLRPEPRRTGVTGLAVQRLPRRPRHRPVLPEAVLALEGDESPLIGLAVVRPRSHLVEAAIALLHEAPAEPCRSARVVADNERPLRGVVLTPVLRLAHLHTPRLRILAEVPHLLADRGHVEVLFDVPPWLRTVLRVSQHVGLLHVVVFSQRGTQAGVRLDLFLWPRRHTIMLGFNADRMPVVVRGRLHRPRVPGDPGSEHVHRAVTPQIGRASCRARAERQV